MARPHHGAPCHWPRLAVEKAGVEWDTPAPIHTGAALIHGKLLAGILKMDLSISTASAASQAEVAYQANLCRQAESTLAQRS